MIENSKYDSIFNNSHTPMLIIDSETGSIKDGNSAACDYYGYSRDKLLEMNISDINIMSPQQIHEEMQKAKKDFRKYFRFRHKLSDGSIKDVEVYSGPVIVDGEHLLFSIIHDIEDKKQMEQRIQIQETYFSSLYENTPEAIAILDNDFRVISINESFERIFQYSIEEIRGVNITEVICEKWFYDESAYFKDSIKRGEFVRQETLRRRKDGTLIDVSFLGYPIISHMEQIGVYAVYSDLSRIKEERMEYERYLKEAKQKAEEASRFKTQFIANMTHEIRTPINGIIGIIELLEETHITEEQQEYFHMLKYSADRLASLINSVLDISKIEVGKLELRNVRFNLRRLVEDAAVYYRILAEKKGLGLTYSIDTDIPAVLIGDPDKLNQVLFNLLSNAVKFTDEGQVAIYARRNGIAEGNVSIEFSVRDTGVGIPEEETQNIFEDFYQLGTISNKGNSGSGLGLSIASKLTRLMGSDIRVESNPGKGSTFSFAIEFPLPEPQESLVSKREKPVKDSRGFTGLNILVVEDDEINRKIIGAILERNRCSVTAVQNGAEALRIIDNQSFDLILMDIYMPEVNGCDTARIIRSKEAGAGRHTPIIAITAALQKEEKESYKEAGIDGYIAKPFNSGQLCSKMEEVLNRGRKEIYNLKPLIDRLEGDNELLNAILDEVVSSEYEDELFGCMEEYIEKKDMERLKKHIHKFKGSLSYFQADSINKIFDALKKACEDCNISTLNELCEKLKVEYGVLKEQLSKYNNPNK